MRLQKNQTKSMIYPINSQGSPETLSGKTNIEPPVSKSSEETLIDIEKLIVRKGVVHESKTLSPERLKMMEQSIELVDSSF